MANISNVYTKRLIGNLKADGERIIRACEQARTYTHRTKNLYDSYGYGVYVNGILKAKGFLNAAQQATAKKKWYGREYTGREEIEAFLDNYNSEQGAELVVVAAVPYAQVLENKQYKVIALAFDQLTSLTSKYGNATVHHISKGIAK